MLRFQHAGRKCIGRVSRFDPHFFLPNDFPTVKLFIHQMHRRARFLDTAREHRLVHPAPVHPGAAEIGQERGVNVDHPAPKARHDRATDFGFDPLVTLSVNGPVAKCSPSEVFTTISYSPVCGKIAVSRAWQLPPESSSWKLLPPAMPGPRRNRYESNASDSRSIVIV